MYQRFCWLRVVGLCFPFFGWRWQKIELASLPVTASPPAIMRGVFPFSAATTLKKSCDPDSSIDDTGARHRFDGNQPHENSYLEA